MKEVKSLTPVCFYPYESHNFKIMTCFKNYLLTLSKIVFVLGEIGYSIKNRKEGEKMERGHQVIKINWELSLE